MLGWNTRWRTASLRVCESAFSVASRENHLETRSAVPFLARYVNAFLSPPPPPSPPLPLPLTIRCIPVFSLGRVQRSRVRVIAPHLSDPLAGCAFNGDEIENREDRLSARNRRYARKNASRIRGGGRRLLSAHSSWRDKARDATPYQIAFNEPAIEPLIAKGRRQQ